MDDSERSYGYSEDIYHGTRRDEERSYEYGPEGGLEENAELAPEEAAIRIEGNDTGEVAPDPDAGQYDYGREGNYATTESFTWDLEASTERGGGEAEEERSGEREEVAAGKTAE